MKKFINIILIIILIQVIYLVVDNEVELKKKNYLLEQSLNEQTEEKEVYINKCKMLEDMLYSNFLDTCECH